MCYISMVSSCQKVIYLDFFLFHFVLPLLKLLWQEFRYQCGPYGYKSVYPVCNQIHFECMRSHSKVSIQRRVRHEQTLKPVQKQLNSEAT